MSAPPLEMNFSIWSANRDFSRESSGAFTVDLKSRYNIRAAALTTAELPMTQYTIEPSWSTFFYDLGWSFESDTATPSPPQVEVRTPAGQLRTVTLPRRFCLVSGRPAGNGAIQWAAFDPPGHGLCLSHLNLLEVAVHFVVDSQQYRLKVTTIGPSGALTTASPTSLSSSNSLSGLLVVGTGLSLTTGPQQLARVFQDALNETTQGGFICALSTNANGIEEWSLTATGPNASADVRPIISTNCRGDICGPLPFTVPLAQLASRSSQQLQLPSGNYDLGSLRSSLEFQLDPLSVWKRPFDSTTLALLVDGAQKACSVNFSNLPLPSCCHPQGIADALTSSFDGAVATVKYANGRFTMVYTPSSGSGLPPLACMLQVVGSLAGALGFPADPQWTLNNNGSFALDALPRQVPYPQAQIRVPAMDSDNFALPSQKTLRITAAPRLGGSEALYVYGADYIISSSASSSSASYSISPGTLLVAVSAQSSVFGLCREFLSGGKTQLKFVPLDPSATVSSGTMIQRLPIPVALSQNIFLYPGPSTQWSRLGEVLGFPPGRSSAEKVPLQAPFMVNLDHPAFVLVEVSLGHCSVNLVHWVKNDFRSNLLAKLPAYCHTRWERSGLLQKLGSGLTTVQQFQIRLLNPWLQPYATHGHNWSCTLLFILSDYPVQLS